MARYRLFLVNDKEMQLVYDTECFEDAVNALCMFPLRDGDELELYKKADEYADFVLCARRDSHDVRD